MEFRKVMPEFKPLTPEQSAKAVLQQFEAMGLEGSGRLHSVNNEV